MPIYEYKCTTCDELHEFLQKFSDPPKSQCPNCGGKLHKLISMNSFQLKGGGWYADGYSSKNSSASNCIRTDSAATSNVKPKEQSSSTTTATASV